MGVVLAFFRKKDILVVTMVLMHLYACSVQENEVIPEPQIPARKAINCSIVSIDGLSTRALIDNNSLQSACTPDINGTSQSIGVWGQYIVWENNQDITYPEFDAIPLTYAPKVEDSNPHNDWNYPGEVHYWNEDARYDFRACFPQALMTSLMTQINANIIQGVVNTSEIQQDLLVAATHVDARDADLTQPVPLNFQHIFSALKFKVKSKDGYTPPADERLTSCWLQNKENATDLFSTSAYLVHSGNENPKIIWYPYESSSVPMYKWEHTGLSFAEENVLYTAAGTITGQEYTGNDGWLLVVPQQVKLGTLQFCYTMKSTGDEVFCLDIPSITYEHGTCYTYLLVISGANVDLKLTISEWNKKDSVHDIIL